MGKEMYKRRMDAMNGSDIANKEEKIKSAERGRLMREKQLKRLQSQQS